MRRRKSESFDEGGKKKGKKRVARAILSVEVQHSGGGGEGSGGWRGGGTRWRRRRAKKIHVILEWFARAECSTHFTALYWALPGSTSLEQGRSWLNPKATSTLLLAAPKRAYCGTDSQKRRSTRLHRSLH